MAESWWDFRELSVEADVDKLMVKGLFLCWVGRRAPKVEA
jgi:hypothetical protein